MSNCFIVYFLIQNILFYESDLAIFFMSSGYSAKDGKFFYIPGG